MGLNNQDHQQTALDTSASVVVQACAGSGKTWLLSSRITRALLEGVPPSGILALTFTNKAAAEMRNRVIEHLQELSRLPRSELRDKLRQWGFAGDALDRAMESAPGAFARFLLDPKPPTICTFHSWYVKLAAMAPLSMAGAATMSLSTRPWDLMRRAWQHFFENQAAHGPYQELVGSIGSSNVRLACEQWVRLQAEWSAFGNRLDLYGMTASESVSCHRDALTANQRAIDDFYQRHRSDAQTLAQAFDGLPSREALVGYLHRWDPKELLGLSESWFTPIPAKDQLAQSDRQRFRLKGGNERFFRKSQEERVWGDRTEALKQKTNALAQGIAGLLDQTDARLASARSQMLWVCGRMLLESLQSVMAQSHEIDFPGLETVAWNLLGGQSAADFHARLDTRIQHILVDEFQDTNPTQWAMLRSWLEQYAQEDHALRQARPKVFLVGDPKQSIYRFRRADPQVFQIASQWLAENYGAIEVFANATRRCGPQIVDFLNRAMPQIASPGRYFPHESLAPEHAGFVGRLPVAQSWQQEGEFIGRALIRIKQDHPHLRWSDMRVLVRARTHVIFYERALAAASIPFVSDRSGGLLAEPEVRDLIALLRCLAFPWSDVDCAQALKSPIFGLSDDHLAQIAQHADSGSGSFFDRLTGLAHQPDTDPRLAEAAALLASWMSWAATLPVHDLLDRIVHGRKIFDRMAQHFSRGRGLQCIANIEAFMALALDLDTGRLPSLPRFLQELHRWSKVKDADAPGPGLMPNADAVSVSTMHSAKGLESAVVVLAGLMDRERSDAGIRWLIDWSPQRDQMRGVRAWQSSDPIDDTARNALTDDLRQSIDEDFNLLYVGATRAKQMLLFSAAQAKKDIDDTWFAKIKEHCDLWDPDADRRAQIGQDAQANHPQQNLAASSDPRPPAYVWRGMELSAAGGHDQGPPRAQSLAIRKGKALHRLLEAGPSLSSGLAMRRLAAYGLAREAQQQVLAAVQAIKDHPWSELIFNPNAVCFVEREWPAEPEFLHPDQLQSALIRPDRIVQVSQSPQAWWIVDFKWDVLDSEHADYVAQLSRYLGVFQRIWPQADVTARILTAQAQAWTLSDGSLLMQPMGKPSSL